MTWGISADPTQVATRLTALRAQIDSLDADLVDLLARRFAVTRDIGRLKAAADLPALDEGREASQRARLRELADARGVASCLVLDVFDAVVTQARVEHEAARRAGACPAADPDSR
jgi:chorismate mutase